jgi:CheY-like chemotaxis protein
MDGKPTILMVDDSENDRFFLRLAFKNVDFDVVLQEAGDGAQAIAYLQGTGRFSDRAQFPLPMLMLLDLNMPLQDGFDVLAWVRAQSGLKRLTIVVLSASTRAQDIEKAFDLGATAYLVKPRNLEALAEMIQALRDWVRVAQFPSLKTQ